ncbi:RHS repeat-associated core domain-containing protein [Pseudomonas sp. R9(2017)]|uniref:RHS repeat-associated core domain-containing protein n=1 Tax=unclassified Pseudomonas TaxID=196821 RepID=UPI000A1EB908
MKNKGRCAHAYTPCGYVAASNNESAIRFTGQWFEPLAGGYMLGNGYRLYSPSLMRFLSQDFLSPFDSGGLNAYAYCNGDPVNKVDPSGHSGRLIGRMRRNTSSPAPPPLISARIESGRRAPENIYSATPSITVEVLMSRHKIDRPAASLVLEGVPLEIVQRSISNKIPLSTNFIEHAKLPKDFLIAGVDELLSTGSSIQVAGYGDSLYYFTLSDNGLNIRNQAQWAARNLNPER